MLHPIDCHVLRLPGQRVDWWELCRESLKNQPINLHELPGILGNYPAARCQGLMCGQAPFVSFVDPDDMVIGAAFDACLEALGQPDVVMAWTDSVTVYGDSPRATARPLRPKHPHQLIVLKRPAIARAVSMGVAGDLTLWGRVAEVGRIVQVPIVGYMWRNHRTTAVGKLARYQAATELPKLPLHPSDRCR